MAPVLPNRVVAVAHARTGTVSLVDVVAGRVVGEFSVGQRLADLVALGPERAASAASSAVPSEEVAPLAAVDEARDELLLFTSDGVTLSHLTRVPTVRSPVAVVWVPERRWLAVAGLWSRSLDLVDLGDWPAADASPRSIARLTLPFAPRKLLVLPDGRLVAADAFEGRIAVVDLASARVEAVHAFPGHNVRGLALSADGRRLLLAQQTLEQAAPATRENVIEGRYMRNVVRSWPLDVLGRPDLDAARASSVNPIDVGAEGAADPAALLATTERTYVAVAGADRLGWLDRVATPWLGIDTARRPTALLPLDAGRVLVLATIGERLQVIDPDAGRVVQDIPFGPPAPSRAADRGESLFFDARISPAGWLSCHSCHTDGHTSGQRADTLGDGGYGAPKRTPSLLGVSITDTWAWTGDVRELPEQVTKSLTTTMHADGLTPRDTLDLVAYLHTLPAAPPLVPEPAGAADAAEAARGAEVFRERGCGECHVPPLTYTSPGAIEVGLVDEQGLAKFNPPSLRGAGQGTRFLHDGRAASLEAVFAEFGHPHQSRYTDDEVRALVRFLKGL